VYELPLNVSGNAQEFKRTGGRKPFLMLGRGASRKLKVKNEK
jgi:hypothetical protein